MLYHVSRSGQIYGPYTLDDLQRYVASGNVLPTDLAKSEEMSEWRPVSEILSAHQPPSPYAAPAQPYAPPYAQPGLFRDPPNLNWGIYLLLSFFTCGIFTIVYEFLQVFWLKSVKPATSVVAYYAVWVVLQFLSAGHSFSRVFLFGMLASHGPLTRHPADTFVGQGISALLSIASFVMLLVYRFTMRSELEEHFNGPEPIGLQLSGILTFFFGSLYFQYHFNRINDLKRAMAYAARPQY